MRTVFFLNMCVCLTGPGLGNSNRDARVVSLEDPSAVVYQDGDSVSFTASMKESFGKVGGCEIEEETTTMEWLAIHFVGTKGESECSISENIELD